MVVHWISPYRQDKDIGKAINDAIKQLNPADDDFIVHCDYDALWLLPESKAQVIEILESTDFDILGPRTNRLGVTNQLVPGIYGEWDIIKHVEGAKLLREGQGNNVRRVHEILAAFCLCFRVSVWKEQGGFCENNLQFDFIFCATAMQRRRKIGIMDGVYVFHLYRPLSANPAMDYKHLVLEKKRAV